MPRPSYEMECMDFLQFLLRRRPQDSAPRLSLYHYFKNFVGEGTGIRASQLSEFSEVALRFSHWRENREELTRGIVKEVEAYWNEGGLEFDIRDWMKPTELSVFQVISDRDMADVLDRFLNERLTAGQSSRVLRNAASRFGPEFVSVQTRSNGGLEVACFDNWACIRSGNVEPLNCSRRLVYDAQLELEDEVQQCLELNPHTVVRFQRQDRMYVGHQIRGYTLLRGDTFSVHELQALPTVFCALKSVERFFVARETDPVYQNIADLLEEAVKLLQDGDPRATEIGERAKLQGEHALKHIFVDDRLIFLLLRELDRELAAIGNTSRAGHRPHRLEFPHEV